MQSGEPGAGWQAADLRASLREVWAGAPAGLPQFWYVSAPSGAGKSHLLRGVQGGEHRRVAASFPGLLPALTGALHGRLAAERHPGRLAVWRAARPDLEWPVLAGDAPVPDGAELHAALTGALGRAAHEGGGLLLTLDGAERATPDDLALLRACWRAACLQSLPLLFVVAGPDPDPDWLRDVRLSAALTAGATVQTHALAPLDLAGMRDLVRAELGPADSQLPGWLLERSGGQPLWATTLLAHLRAGGALRPAGGAWTFTPPDLGALPGSLAALLRGRWTELRTGGPEDEVADLLALSDTLSLSELRALTGLDAPTLRRVTDRLLGQGALRVDLEGGEARLSLAHPSLAEVGRQALSAGEETRLLSRLVEHSPDPHRRARMARQIGHPQALELTRAALDAARLAQAPALVAEHAAALLALEPQQEREERLGLLALAQGQLGLHREAAQSFAALTRPDAQAAEAHARTLMNLGDYAAGLERIAALPSPLPASLDILRTRLQMHLGRLEDAQVALDGLLTRPDTEPHRAQLFLARAHHALLAHDAPRLGQEARSALAAAGTDGERADALNFAALAHSWLGEFAPAEDAYRECLTLLRQSGREGAMQAAYGNLANLHLTAARYREAQEAQATCLKLARLGGTPIIEMNATGALGMTRVMLGDEGGLDGVRAWQAHYAAHVPAGAPFVTLHAANAHALFGDRDRARAYLAEVPEEAMTGAGYGPVTLAQIYLLLGEPEQARRLLAAAPDYAGDPVGELSLPLARAQLLAVEGEENAALELLAGQRDHPHISRFPSLEAEYDWLRLALRRRQGAPEGELQALGARVRDFLHRTGGHGFLLLVDGLFPEDRAERRAYLLAPAEGTPAPFLRTLGHFDLEEGGAFRPWRARKVRELLALLLCAHVGERPAVSREALTDALWPELPEGLSEANFRKTLARLRAALGGAARIEHGPGGYALAGLRGDLPLFLEACERRDLSAACAWYGGPFLPGLDLPEVEPVRAALHGRWRRAALTLAQEQPPAQAQATLARLLRDDPYDVDALTLLGDLAGDAGESAQRDLEPLLVQLEGQHRRDLGELAPELQRVRRRQAGAGN